MIPVESEELLREKNLIDVYRAARVLPVSAINQIISAGVFVALLLYVALTGEGYPVLADKVRSIADYGFGFSTSMLSFLIAGFTIYLSVTKSELLVFLATTRNENSGLPELKHVAFMFMRTMANFMIFCILCVAIKLFGSSSGLISLAVELFATDPAFVKLWLARIALVVVGTGLVHMLMLLQSFVFNIYHTAMLAVVWEQINSKLEKPEQSKV